MKAFLVIYYILAVLATAAYFIGRETDSTDISDVSSFFVEEEVANSCRDTIGICGTTADDCSYSYTAADSTLVVSGKGAMNEDSHFGWWSYLYQNIRHVRIDGLTSIGFQCFYGCNKLASVTINNGLIYIGKQAFYNCSNLTSIAIPRSVTTIGEQAFSGCSALTAINIDAANVHYSSKDGVLFNKHKTTLIHYPERKLVTYPIPYKKYTNYRTGSYAIPHGVSTIGNNAFEDCGCLTSVIIPNSVTTIGESAFQSSGLTSVKIPNSVTTIGESAFRACFYLTSVSIGSGVTTIGDAAFYDCDDLKTIYNYSTIPQPIADSSHHFYFDEWAGRPDGYVPADMTYHIHLYVPAASVAAYRTAAVWKDFRSVRAIR